MEHMHDTPLDFIAIGDTAVDEFIRLKDASVHCDIDTKLCTISMRWGDKIPFEYSVLVPGVGNAANAAVAAARLGLSAGFMSNIGNDRYGEETLASFAKEGVHTSYVRVHDGMPTNHHYVLWFEAERTILIKHELYPYAIPAHFTPPRWMYLSSTAENSEPFHHELSEWLAAHSETKLAFQPGTFQMKMGKEKLAALYARTEVIACNKEEAERILERSYDTMTDTLKAMHSLGPSIVLITDGPKGAYAYDGSEMLMLPMYPDPKPPIDRTGAGDATTSTFVAALALGKPLAEALQWGPVNSMSVVQEIGAQKGLLSRDHIEELLAKAPAAYRVTTL